MHRFMNNLLKVPFIRATEKVSNKCIKNVCEMNSPTRAFGHMCSGNVHNNYYYLKQVQRLTPCIYQSKNIHTKGEKELIEFLSEEIAAEKATIKSKSIPTVLDGFKVKLDGSEVTLSKEVDNEKISINFNINHTVDSDAEPEINPSMDKPELGEMKSKPSFDVQIVRGSKTLEFSCSFLEGSSSPHENDIFGIDEFTIYEGESTDKTYVIAGDVVDGYLYDLLMNILDEKGITNEFVDKLSNLSTVYEHSSYVALLENLQHFTSKK